jgi:tetratricopeptide (TPR) repeat protein
VPSSSSLDVFPANSRAVIPGNHLEIVKPQNQDHLGLQLVTKTLVKDAAPAGPWNSAKVAVESREFRKAILLLEPHASALDEAGLVELALAYDGVGRTVDSITLLEAHGRDRTDAMGTLAGRLKRRWMLERRTEDYNRALKLYSDALQLALNETKPDQIYYHAINVAFLKLVAGDRSEALKTAQQALDYAQRGDLLQWRLATRAEGFLMLGNVAEAVESYKQALAATTIVREIESMYKQAMWIAEVQKNSAAVPLLKDVFRHSVEPGV